MTRIRIRARWFQFVLLLSAALTAGAFVQSIALEPAGQGASRPHLRAGAATSNITPWLGDAIVGGWNSPPAKHIHDELHARCLVLDDGQRRIAIVVADSVGIPREVFDEAKRQILQHTGLPISHMLMSASHSHSATNSRPNNVLLPGDELTEYQRFVAHRISDGVRRAVNNLEPAKIAWGAASQPSHVFNRRWFMKPGTPLPDPFGASDRVRMNPGRQNPSLLKPAGPIDPEVCFLAIQSAGGRPIALLANYSLHYVGGTGPQHISADYFAMFADRIQQLIGADRLDPPFVGIMSNGTSANVNNINFAAAAEKRKPYEQMQAVADGVAQAVFEQYKNLRYQDWVPLDLRQRELTLAVRKPTPGQLAHARDMLAHPDRPDSLPHERTYAERTMLQQDAPATISVIVQALRIGDLGIAAIPFETFVETGLQVKAGSPFKPSFTISLANGTYGYLPTPEQHELGGYETWLGTSKVERDASTKIAASVLEMFAELDQGR